MASAKGDGSGAVDRTKPQSVPVILSVSEQAVDIL